MVDGVNKLAVTKLDVLDSFDKIGVASPMRSTARSRRSSPHRSKNSQRPGRCSEWLPGWKQDISGVSNYDELPENAKKYLERITELVDSELAIVSVGPAADQTFEI